MSLMRRIAATGAVATTIVAGSLAGSASPAHAAGGWNGCYYPQVCVYNSDEPTASALSARFMSITSYVQYSRTRTHWSVENTRHDDVVYVRMRNARSGATGYKCVNPGWILMNMDQYHWQITGIRIDNRSHC